MTTARKYTSNSRPMSRESRNNAIAAIQICWKQMRPDLHGDKDALREERLVWIASFLQLRRPLGSITDLSDKQMGIVLEEMRRMTGTQPKPKQSAAPREGNIVNIADYRHEQTGETTDAEVTHLAGEAQIYTINKLVGSIGWSEEGFRDFLFQKFRRRSPRMLKFKEANALTMILLNIAADKELRAQGKTKISRKMTAEHIPLLKRKLQIDR